MLDNNETSQVIPVATTDNSLVDVEDDLASKTQEALQQLIQAETPEELKTRLDLFNINQTKKNVLRIKCLGDVLDKVDAQLFERLNMRPDQISTKDIIDIMNAVSSQVDRMNSFNTKMQEAERPAITAVNNKTEINVNVAPQLSREERDGVLDAVSTILKQLKQPRIDTPQLYPELDKGTLIEVSDDSVNTETTEQV